MEWIIKVSENYIQYVNAAINGNTDAIAKLYSRTLKASYFLASTLCGSKEEAADITKKAYARAFCNIDKLKRPEAFEIWMKQNVAAIYKETQKFIFADADAGAVENSSEFLSENVLEDAELSAKVLSSVTALRPELKTALVLHYNNGMPVQALAKFLGVSESTANALLGKARACVLESAQLDLSAVVPSGSLPVITRLFQRDASNVQIDNVDVRDIFIYAMDAYEASKPAKPIEEPAVQSEPEAEIKAEVTEASPEENISSQPQEEAQVPADNVIMFKQKINDMLGGEGESAQEQLSVSSSDNDEVVDVPDIPVAHGISNETLDNFGGAAQTKAVTPVLSNKKKFDLKNLNIKNLNPKFVIIAVVALVVIVVGVIGIAVVAGGDGKGSKSGVSQEQSEYTWKAGGFGECSEIGYLNEDVAYYKSTVTGKYGVMDYQGNVILNPVYEKFENCGTGRDYDGTGTYHTLVIINDQKFELTVENGNAVISENPHAYHSIDTVENAKKIEGKKYDERDRYFEGYAAARKDGKWGYVSEDKDKKVIPYEYDAVNNITDSNDSKMDYCRPVTSSGLIPVKKDGKMGIINLDNDIVVPFEYTDILPGNNGVFIACKGSVWGVILTGDAQNTFKGVNFVANNEIPEVTDPDEENSIGKYKVTDEDGANVRKDAGSDYDLVGELDYGDVVVGYETKRADNGNRWLKIKINGEYGWVSLNMLEKE